MSEQFESMDTRTLYYTKTIIIHSKRKRMNISINQYALCDVIEKFIEKHGNMTKPELRAMVDIYHITDPVEEFKKLKELGITDITKSGVVLTKKWNDLPPNHKDMFEEFWKEYGMVGNKKSAIDMFIRFLKSGETFETLTEKYWPKYKSYLGSGATQLHLSTYLNPENERYKDNFVSNAHYKKVDKDVVVIDFEKQSNPKNSR